MPFPLTLTTPDGATAYELLVPTRWPDVTLAQFVAAFAPAEGEPRSTAEVLLGLDAGSLDTLAADDAAYLANLLAFAADPSPVLELLPTPGLPDIGTLSYGTLLLAQQALAADPDRPALAYLPRLLALYRTTLLHGSAEAGRVAACEAALLAAPVTESYADAAFFLASLKAWQSGTRPTPTMPASLKRKNSKPAQKSLRTGSGRFSAWMRRLAAPS